MPDSWHWPVGVSLSQEFSYQRRIFSTDTWTWEIRPIIDKQMGPWYWSLNPALEKAITGENAGRGKVFSPPKWEINLGVGRGLTASTDRWLVKTIFGYRLEF